MHLTILLFARFPPFSLTTGLTRRDKWETREVRQGSVVTPIDSLNILLLFCNE
jgi:hypothetical protein